MVVVWKDILAPLVWIICVADLGIDLFQRQAGVAARRAASIPQAKN
jgi:hypothetical protein